MADLLDKKKKEVKGGSKKDDQGSSTQNRNIMRSELRKVIGERSYVSEVQYMFMIGTLIIMIIIFVNMITLGLMIKDTKYFDSYVLSMQDFRKVFVS